jgi:Lysylphosphatidylglycerol synthase TM region
MLFVAVSVDEDVRLLSLIEQSKLPILKHVVFPI